MEYLIYNVIQKGGVLVNKPEDLITLLHIYLKVPSAINLSGPSKRTQYMCCKFSKDGYRSNISDFISEHGEWELVSSSYESVVKIRDMENFSQMVFTVKLKRRILFHTLNTLFPVVLMGFLTVTHL